MKNMKMIMVGFVMGLMMLAGVAYAGTSANTTCSSTSSCKPRAYDYVPQSYTGPQYRVAFVEVVGADVYKWYAGPFWSMSKAQTAVSRLQNTSNVVDSSVRIQVGYGTAWANYAE